MVAVKGEVHGHIGTRNAIHRNVAARMKQALAAIVIPHVPALKRKQRAVILAWGITHVKMLVQK